MKLDITYREMKFGEEEQVNAVITEVFNKYIAQYYTKEGLERFYDYISIDNINKRIKRSSFILVACENEKVIGVIEIRDDNHISQLFVMTDYHKRGIANNLVMLALAKARKNNIFIRFVGVNASPYAVNFYKKLGFVAISPEILKCGARFTPMRLAMEYIDY